ncbi:DUF7114 family protein [Natrialba swarupiae]|uniref:Uncharacterized protein n=1 Tax=Natrialba swarupiae TaxID=2448032 RepID=A0A5D5ANL8_9EURY|nr:hypothetical protein [Natrialba swarupiae]MCW8173112.1 hypothetical protein [Natrialba swarupiae]TYT63286.1 hypothetical protein FYC77_04240 [Natrialba swarupiae]
MEEADDCRRAAVEAVADVEPPRLHDLVETILEDASMVPGVLTIESAGVATRETTAGIETRSDSEDAVRTDSSTEGVLTHAAGVQLIYEGLRLTRTLAHEEPWHDDGEPHDDGNGDLEILAADILVARGFYLLARTDAAGKAVRTVQAFGRDQTERDDLIRADGPGGDPADLDANLERDVLELAVLTGAAAADETPSPRLLSTADDLADDFAPSFPPVEKCRGAFARLPSERSLEDHTTDRATSATDP